MDARGVCRGKCKSCSNCGGYTPPSSGLKCSQCGCPPARHLMMVDLPPHEGDVCSDPIQTALPTPSLIELIQPEMNTSVPLAVGELNQHIQPEINTSMPSARGSVCVFPGCFKTVGFDLNSGIEHSYCQFHIMGSSEMCVEDIELDDDQLMYGNQYSDDMNYTHDQDLDQFSLAQVSKDSSLCIIPGCLKPRYVDTESGIIHNYCGKTHAEEAKIRGLLSGSVENMGAMAPPGIPQCAIDECPNPCYVDDSGTVHECCGVTHAMEHQRRQALWQQVNQQIVKGITHCLLPNCNKQTWPFENYCGRSHADRGLQMGLKPPPPVGGNVAGPKDSSLCIIPGCQKPKFIDSSTGATHDYCGKSHAEEGKRRGIYATADKVEDQCDLPGCTNKKRTEGGTVYDYCCRDHAQKDAPNRDAKILTSMSEVQKFLNKFSNLKVVCLKENDHAKPGGALFNKFKSAMMALPANQRNTCLAFHGTRENNIDSICKTGYDPNRRCGQAHGAGEYFATSPSTPLGYCKGGKKMLLNELLLGQNGTHHTKHGDVIVMKNPVHDLPRFVITFK